MFKFVEAFQMILLEDSECDSDVSEEEEDDNELNAEIEDALKKKVKSALGNAAVESTGEVR